MKLTVKMFARESLELEVTPDDHVEEVEMRILEAVGERRTKPIFMRLVYLFSNLQPGTLRHNGIVDDAIIGAVLGKVPPPPPPKSTRPPYCLPTPPPLLPPPKSTHVTPRISSLHANRLGTLCKDSRPCFKVFYSRRKKNLARS